MFQFECPQQRKHLENKIRRSQSWTGDPVSLTNNVERSPHKTVDKKVP